ncbi:MAG: UDP-N-acetylmuramate dehydrogenase [Sulfurimonadaceae bacterium]|jgi:UDP-N-acetylmuramate dehydrogenase|nr:UDP-N-acetylmuramate dehydrogenase [Sulfurimonadaceae bacterium]
MRKKLIDFSVFSSIKIGPKVEVDIIDECNELQDEHFLIGSCNNLIVSQNPPPLAKLSKKFDYINTKDNTLSIGAATPSGKIFSFAKKHNISDFEFLSSLPGTLGGLVFMNAGLKEFEIFDNIISIKTCRGEILKKDIEFGYRYTKIDSTILEATFKLSYGFDEKRVAIFKAMRANQPSTPSAGSCFKNPKGDFAGRVIEGVGLKGFRVGGASFSDIHANFLVNHGGATYEDVLKLIDEAKKRVKATYDIELELEIKLVN